MYANTATRMHTPSCRWLSRWWVIGTFNTVFFFSAAGLATTTIYYEGGGAAVLPVYRLQLSDPCRLIDLLYPPPSSVSSASFTLGNPKLLQHAVVIVHLALYTKKLPKIISLAPLCIVLYVYVRWYVYVMDNHSPNTRIVFKCNFCV